MRTLRRDPTSAFRRGPIILVGLVGVGGLVISWIQRGNSYAASLWIELGAGALLFAALYWFQRRVVEREIVDSVNKQTEPLTRELEDVRREVAEVKSELSDLGKATQATVDQRIQGHEDSLERFVQNVGVETTRDLLERASGLRAISKHGIRLRIPATYSWLALRAVDQGVMVTMQDRGAARNLRRWLWKEGLSLPDLFAEVAEELMRMNEYPPDGSFDASFMMEQFRKTAALAIRSRTGRAYGMLNPLIELPNDQWAITRLGLEAFEHGYQISIYRLKEPWFPHLAQKVWVDIEAFEEAFYTAEALLDGHHYDFYPLAANAVVRPPPTSD